MAPVAALGASVGGALGIGGPITSALATKLGLGAIGLGGIGLGLAKKAMTPKMPGSSAAGDAYAAAKAAEAKSKAEAEATASKQNAKQFAAANTPSRGFGSNSLENLSRSFLLRL